MRATLVAAGEQQPERARVGSVDDQRPRVAALAEGLAVGAGDLDLSVEAQPPGREVDDDVVDLDCRDGPVCQPGGAAELGDGEDVFDGDDIARRSDALDLGDDVDPVGEQCQRCVDVVDPSPIELLEALERGDRVARRLPAIEPPRLEDRVPDVASVLVGETWLLDSSRGCGSSPTRTNAPIVPAVMATCPTDDPMRSGLMRLCWDDASLVSWPM